MAALGSAVVQSGIADYRSARWRLIWLAAICRVGNRFFCSLSQLESEWRLLIITVFWVGSPLFRPFGRNGHAAVTRTICMGTASSQRIWADHCDDSVGYPDFQMLQN